MKIRPTRVISVAALPLIVGGALAACATYSRANENVCAMVSIPDGARRLAAHGVDFYLYPVKLHSEYDGCQTMWLEDGRRLWIAHFSRGKLQKVELNEPKKSPIVCHYVDGAAPNPRGCPPANQFPFDLSSSE